MREGRAATLANCAAGAPASRIAGGLRGGGRCSGLRASSPASDAAASTPVAAATCSARGSAAHTGAQRSAVRAALPSIVLRLAGPGATRRCAADISAEGARALHRQARVQTAAQRRGESGWLREPSRARPSRSEQHGRRSVELWTQLYRQADSAVFKTVGTIAAALRSNGRRCARVHRSSCGGARAPGCGVRARHRGSRAQS